MTRNESGYLDCVIVGAGPAGLTAALYLARYGRRFALIDNGQSRAAWIPESHNIPVFAQGIAGPDILKRQREHAELYGAKITIGTVTRIEREPSGFQVIYTGESQETAINARFVLLAAGVVDIGPQISDMTDAVRRGLIRFCPICDGFEAKDRKIAVISLGKSGIGEALFIERTYTNDVTLLSLGEPLSPSVEEEQNLAQSGIHYIQAPIVNISASDEKISATQVSGETLFFDSIYAAMGVQYRSDLGTQLGAATDDKGAISVDAHCETTIPGLYAAGDVTQGLNQIVAAMGQAAIAATAIHNRCIG